MRIRTLFLLSVLATAVPALAQEAQPAPTPTPPPPESAEGDPADASYEETRRGEDRVDDEVTPATMARGAPMMHGRLALTLAEALKMGLENNLDVQVERYSPLIAEYNEDQAWGAFDPEAFATFGYQDARNPTSSILVTGPNPGGEAEVIYSTSRITDGASGLRGLVPWLGAEYNVQYTAERRSSLSAAFESLSPEYRSTASLNVTVPLLKDLIWNQPWTQVKTSRILLETSLEDFRRSVMDTVTSIEDAYWALIAQDEARRVARKSLETAAALLDQTRTQFEVGVVSKVEVTEAEAGLSQREVNLIRAENSYRNQQDVLIDLVLGPGLKSGSTLEIDPSDRPEEYVPYVIEVEAAVERAFEARPELESARKEIERQRIQLKFAENQRLPSLDFEAGYAYQGLSGKGSGNSFAGSNPATGDIGNFGDTFDGFFSDDRGTTWSTRGLFSIPFPNTAARAGVSRTEMELRRAETRKHRLEQTIILEVRRAARNLEASQEAIDAARDAERAAQEQLRAERIRLEYGESTPFDVLQREEDLVDRENELIGAFQAYRTSVTALDRAQGTILRNRNIKIAEVSPLR